MAENAEETDALKSDIEQQAIEPQAEDAGLDESSQPAPLTPTRSLTRRASVYIAQYEEKTNKEQVACIATYALLIASAPAIAAVIIAHNYDAATSACNDGTKYLIDPQTYLYVAGGVQLGMSGIYFFTQIVAFLCFTEEAWIKTRIFMSQGCCRVISSLYPLWHLIWAIIGVYIYAAEMSKACQNEQIGVMILAWCILEFIAVCCMSCCIMCWALIVATSIVEP